MKKWIRLVVLMAAGVLLFAVGPVPDRALAESGHE